MGKTDSLLDIIGQRLDQAPAPILYVGPNKQFLSEQFEPRVMALLDEAPTLRDKVARGKRMTKTRKVIAGVPLRLAHAGSSTALKSDPAALALTDEVDEMLANVKGQGDPIGLIDARGITYPDFVNAIVSTPSEGPSDVELDEASGLEFWKVQDPQDLKSAIWKLWQSGTRYHFAWPCPHCEEYFIPRFRCLQWPKKASPAEALSSTFLACPRCGAAIHEADKVGMNERGVYVAPGQVVISDGTVLGDPPFSTALSFWVSGLCSPFRTFGERAADYLTAIRQGDQSAAQTAINAGFGELWAPSAGEAPEWMEVSRKGAQSSYRRGEVPDGVKILTLAADVQKQSIWWGIRGFGPKATSWLIDYGELLGDTAEEDVWAALGDILVDTYDGVPIRLAFVDSGFRPGKAETLPINRVYQFCRHFGSKVRPTKGSSSPMRTPLIVSKIEVTSSGRTAKYGLDLVRLDTDHWKSWVHERLRWPAGALGAWYVPQDIEDDYARQIVSEARVKLPSGRVQWIQRAKDNHLLDVEAMLAAAGYMLNAQRIVGDAPAATVEQPTVEMVVEDGAVVEKAPKRSLDDVVMPASRPLFTRRVMRSNHMRS